MLRESNTYGKEGPPRMKFSSERGNAHENNERITAKEKS